ANSLGTAQPVGIFLQNNVGTFQITGVAGAPGSGGQILGPGFNLANSSVGFFANNADRVILRNQDYTSNDIGLIFQNMNGNTQQGFLLDSLRVQDSIQEAVLASDVRNITIV